MEMGSLSKHYQHWFYQEMGRRIKAARVALGLTQYLAAKLIGISRVALAEIESGRQRLSIFHLRRTAFVLGEDVLNLVPTKGDYSKAVTQK